MTVFTIFFVTQSDIMFSTAKGEGIEIIYSDSKALTPWGQDPLPPLVRLNRRHEI